jgi:lysophospholipase L1-like esterase
MFILLALAGCEKQTVESRITGKEVVLNDQQIRNLSSKKIFFGHQSVGTILSRVFGMWWNGIPDWGWIWSPRRILKQWRDLRSSKHISGWTAPASKTEAFNQVLDKGLGKQGGIALYKYCYIDFGSNTDVAQVFSNYRKGIAELHEKYPSLTVVHSTVPLTSDQPSQTIKDQIKDVLRELAGRDANVKRNEFNRMLKDEYGSKDPIVDLAEIESTHPDGSRSFFSRGTQKVYTLAPEFTRDGGHLNELGRRRLAERLLFLLANL